MRRARQNNELAVTKAGAEPSNTRYGYVVPSSKIDHGVFA